MNSHEEIALTHELNVLRKGIGHLFQTIQSEFPEKLSPKYIGDKFPDYIFEHSRIRKKFPEARTICIFRNPLHVLNSMMYRRKVARQGGDPSWNNHLTLMDALDYWKYAWSLCLEDENLIAVKYEDLISHTDHELGRLADVLGLENRFRTSLIEHVQKPGTDVTLTTSQMEFVDRQLGGVISNWQLSFEDLKAKCPTIQKPLLMKARVRMKAAKLRLHNLLTSFYR